MDKATYKGVEYKAGMVLRCLNMGGYNVHTILGFEENYNMGNRVEVIVARPYANASANSNQPLLGCETYSLPLIHLDRFVIESDGYVLEATKVK